MKLMKKFKKNNVGNDYIIGDIHAQYDKLIKQLQSINFNKNIDRLFAVGDLIDRGGQSSKVVSLLKENWFFSTMGNHEFMMIEVFKNQNMDYFNDWMNDGGKWIYGEDINKLIPLIEKLPLFIEIDQRIGLCHANPIVNNWLNLNGEFIKKHMISIMTSKEFVHKKEKDNIKNIDHVFVGHNMVSSIKELGNIKMIDTGSCFEKPFSIIKI